MPALQSPEVTKTVHADFVFFSQVEHAPDPEFGPGESLNAQMVMLGNIGLNPIFNQITVSSHLASSQGSPDLIRIVFSLRDHWAGKDAFIAEMNLEGVLIQESRHPYDAGVTTLSVRGPENIFKLGQSLRDRYEVIQLEVDELLRPIVHPELLGLALEQVDTVAAAMPVKTNSFHVGAYRHDWAI
jgi:hypothetical protein